MDAESDCLVLKELLLAAIVKCKCTECDAVFETTSGNLMQALAFRCENCDLISYVKTDEIDSYVEQCESCQGKTSKGLRPMCPECKSRLTEEVEILVFID